MFFSFVEQVLLRKNIKVINGSQVMNITMGLFERLISFYMIGLLVTQLHYLADHWVLIEMNSTLLVFLISFILVDLSWYIYHYLGHKVSVVWGVHLIHHIPEEFNLSVAFVNSPVGTIIRGGLYIALVLIGFPVEFVVTSAYLKSAYQFFLHTELWSSIPYFDQVFVMPKHHRVHHAKNDVYMDKNFGGVFIIWDRVFGTFQEETELPVYGITDSVIRKDFISVQLYYFRILLKNFKDFGLLTGLKMLLINPSNQKKLSENIDCNDEKQSKEINHNSLLIYSLVVLFLIIHFFIIQFSSSRIEALFVVLGFFLLLFINGKAIQSTFKEIQFKRK